MSSKYKQNIRQIFLVYDVSLKSQIKGHSQENLSLWHAEEAAGLRLHVKVALLRDRARLEDVWYSTTIYGHPRASPNPIVRTLLFTLVCLLMLLLCRQSTMTGFSF